MMEWFNNLSDANKIAIIVPVSIAVISGVFALGKWLFAKKDRDAPQQDSIHQTGEGNKLYEII